MGSSFVFPPAKRSIVYSSTGIPEPNPASINGSSKKCKNLPSPHVVLPGHVALRILCHASRIGGVIGKSGFIIKQLQQSTGAKIHVEDAPPESPDRVVIIIAPISETSKILLPPNSTDPGVNGEEIQVSKAQEALLKVFQRILEVASETEGVEIGLRVVSCRLLVDAAQVGAIIGKGGKVVEKIRNESGCKIRVFREKLPVCAGISDEMVEIEGDAFSIKRALISISRCLQDCPPIEKIGMVSSRPSEAVLRENLPDLRMDHLLERNSLLPTMPTSSINFSSGVNMLLDVDRAHAVDTKLIQHEVTFKILCTNDRAGGVIGRGGTIIKALQNESGASISVGVFIADCDERLITITASENPESLYSPAQKAAVLVFSRSIEAGKELDSGSSKGSTVTARLVVPSNQVGCLLGKGGAIVTEIRKVTGTSIKIILDDEIPKCAPENNKVVQISGEFPNVQDALYNITGRLRDNLFSVTLSSASRSSSALFNDSSSYGRFRDTSSYERNMDPTYPVIHSLQPVPHTFTRCTALTQSMDHLGIPYGLDHTSSPRLWVSQPSGIHSRESVDIVRGLTSLKGGLELGSGSMSALVTNTTVEIVVPENVIGSIYGENGTNLARLRQISGAKVTVHEPRPGSSDRMVVISGTPEETQAAQSLLHAFIVSGSS